MSSYGGSYKPFRINYSRCSKCPPPEILTDTNGNDSLSLIRTKKSRCAYLLKNGLLGYRSPFNDYSSTRNSNVNINQILNCNSLNNNVGENSTSTALSVIQCNKDNSKIPSVNAFGRIEGSPYGSGSRPVNRFN